jgi:hypothetical protein
MYDLLTCIKYWWTTHYWKLCIDQIKKILINIANKLKKITCWIIRSKLHLYSNPMAYEEEESLHDHVCLEIILHIHLENEYNHVFVLEEECRRVCLKYLYKTNNRRFI